MPQNWARIVPLLPAVGWFWSRSDLFWQNWWEGISVGISVESEPCCTWQSPVNMNTVMKCCENVANKLTLLNHAHKMVLLCVSNTKSSLTLSMQGSSYPSLTKSISWLLMPWLLASPGHQHPWFWLCRIGKFLSYTRKDFNYLWHIKVEEWQQM